MTPFFLKVVYQDGLLAQWLQPFVGDDGAVAHWLDFGFMAVVLMNIEKEWARL